MNTYSVKPLFAALLGSALISAPAIASSNQATDESLEAAITNGKTTVNLRLRAAGADRDGFDDKASALTLRTRLGYETGNYKGFTIFGEYEGVSAAGGEAYAGTPGEIATKQRFIIADPTGSELNQIYLKYQGYDSTAIVGRQRVVINNARMVGNVGWRQNEQTFDGVTVKTKAAEALDLELYYLNKSHFIFFNTIKLDSSAFANARFKLGNGNTLTAYGFWLGVEGGGVNNTKTFGLRYAGSYPMANGKLFTTVEYAKQGDYENYSNAAGDESFSADYINYELGFSHGKLTAQLGYELLGSDNGIEAVTFPLATNHKFNGWADIFLTTPDNGLQDISVALTSKYGGFVSKLVYHDYKSDEGSIDYGSEIDLLFAKKLSKNLKLIAKLAMYDADQLAADTERLTFDLNYSF